MKRRTSEGDEADLDIDGLIEVEDMVGREEIH
jgi:hypothetical protein